MTGSCALESHVAGHMAKKKHTFLLLQGKETLLILQEYSALFSNRNGKLMVV